MSVRWIAPAPVEPEVVAACSPALGLPPRIVEVLARRGYTDPDQIKAFLRPHLGQLHPPTALHGVADAVERLLAAIEHDEPVLVYGDYDVDGITSTVLLTRVLRGLGGRVDWFIPHRIEHGYGLSEAGLREVAARGPRVLVLCDCGIGAVAEIRAARELGIDVVVADHHEPGPELPEAFAVIDPKQPACSYPERSLAAVGVTFKLCQALYERLGRERRELYRYLDLVALGTIADLVPAIGENRVFMRFGLLQLERTQNAGLRALLELTGLAGRPLTDGSVGFVLAPRINAVGRMSSGATGAQLLLTDDAGEAARLAAVLEEENRHRRESDRRTLEEARGRLAGFDPERDVAIVLASSEWHPGVLGIVASRLVEEFYRPSVLVGLGADGTGKGSARSISALHLHRALTACAEHLLQYGGHALAAGLRIRADRFESFARAFEEHVRAAVAPADFVRTIRIDMDIPELQECGGLFRLLEHLAPYGPGNERPVLSARELRVVGYPRIVGEDHVRMRVTRGSHSLDTIGFRMADRLRDVNPGREDLAIAFTLEVDDFTGRGELQARLLDLRAGP